MVSLRDIEKMQLQKGCSAVSVDHACRLNLCVSYEKERAFAPPDVTTVGFSHITSASSEEDQKRIDDYELPTRSQCVTDRDSNHAFLLNSWYVGNGVVRINNDPSHPL